MILRKPIYFLMQEGFVIGQTVVVAGGTVLVWRAVDKHVHIG